MFSNLDWSEILNSIRSFATSDIAKQEVRNTQPLSNAETATQQIREIEEARRILELGIRPFFKSLDLFSLWYERLSRKATLKPLEFRDVRHFCVESIALEEVLSPSSNSDFAQRVLASLMDARKPLSAIEQILAPDGEVRTDASEKLFHLFRDKQEKEREIRTTLDRLVKSHQMEPVLQDKYVTNREGRWVLPVRSGMRHDLDGIIHDVSQTKQTVFMEPQAVVQINNALRQIESQITEEIERLLKELSHYLTSLCDEFNQTRSIFELCDIRFAQAQFSKQVDAAIPTFSKDKIRLREVRHPLLSLQLDASKVVSNSVQLDSRQSILLLSGPNAGGKTVLLKSIGLAAQMARCGLPICANSGSEIPFFETILTAVGDSQSVDQHLSTFAAHLKMLSRGLELKGSKNLILIDEICGSTDPEEGTALARSFIEHYAKQSVYAIITSHLGPLKSGWAPETKVVIGSMDFDEKSSQPTYQLVMGVSGSSLAIKTAKKVGVPIEVVHRALDLIGPEAKAREDKLAELDGQRQELSELKEQYQKMSQEAKSIKQRYNDLVEKFKADKDKWLQKSVAQAEKKIQSIYEEMRSESAKTKSIFDFKAQLPQILKTPQVQKVESAEDFAKFYPAGSSVNVKTLGQDAIVQGAPNAKGEVPVLSNSMRLFVHWTSLSAPKAPQNQTPTLARKSGIVTLSLQSEDREIDLRGQRVEEALERLESELDIAVRNKEERIRVIHGHGTEALKKAVRTYFTRSVYVKKWKAGDPSLGGDGITWVELAD